MKILGISPLDKDATASFVEDGRVVFACGEERLSRTKLQDGFPMRAVQLGLQRTGWTPEAIDVVAYSFFDGLEETRLMRAAQATDARVGRESSTADSLRLLQQRLASGYRVDRARPIPGLDTEASEFMAPKAWWKRFAYRLASTSPALDRLAHRLEFQRWIGAASADHHRRTEELLAGLRALGLEHKLQRFNHHLCHAANAFHASGYERALVVLLDGYGSGHCGAIYEGSADGLRLLHEIPFPNSLGQFYEYVTSGLGFRAGRHEGKIVGLAAYGDPEVLSPALLARFAGRENGQLVMQSAMNFYLTRHMAQHVAKRDVAAAYQHVLERVTQDLVRYWVGQRGLQHVAMSGGVHANVKLNQRVREVPGVAGVFVYPNMGDGGCATGAAFVALGRAMAVGRPVEHVYLGPDYTEAEMAAALDREQLRYERHDAIEPVIAQHLAANRIVARFHGRMEYGPRALGNRSILYPATDPQVNQWLNHQLGRTEFMPFAPAVMAEHAPRLFQRLEGCEHTAQFMTVTFDCTAEMRERCPAAVHVDGTARPQLVSARTNPSFHRVLEAYCALTGIPVLINTSFNMHEEPIVCSPDDAVRAFLDGRIDYLAIGPFLVPHPTLGDIDRERAALAASA